jgi:hypothetical protein
VSSIKPNHAGRQMHGGEEVPRGFVVTSGDRAILLEFGEEVLDQVTGRVEVSIELPLLLPIGLRWDRHLLAGGSHRLDDAFIGVIGLVGDERFGVEVGQEFIGSHQIMGLAAGQIKVGRITERVNACEDLCAQSAARAADSLVFAVFFWAPALC